MKLEEADLQKMDPLLAQTLSHAEGGEPVRAVLRLGSLQSANKNIASPLSPKDFSSPRSYREHLIAQRQAEVKDTIGPTLDSLKNLDLMVRGGGILRTIVVEGAASQVLAALELPGVINASLDRALALDEGEYKA
jgi:hypothetical protein